MKLTTIASSYCTLLLLCLGAAAGADKPTKSPKAPGLTYLYTVNITGGEFYNVGAGPRGTRLVVPILKGNFAGPKLKGASPKQNGVAVPLRFDISSGVVMPMGGDWALTDGHNVNGSLTVDVRQTFKTDDGAFIQVFETGQLQPDGSAFVRLGYETGSEKYYWLNSVVALGIIRSVGTSDISIDTWQVSMISTWLRDWFLVSLYNSSDGVSQMTAP